MTSVLVNGAAAGGGARRKWTEIEGPVNQHLGAERDLAVFDDEDLARRWIEERLTNGEVRFVAAGGDGTVNLLLDTIMKRAPADVLPGVRIGAVGLGSSNDFHKPFRQDRQMRGVPYRLDFASTIAHDVCLLTSDDNEAHHWIVNASIGLTAEANRFFNERDSSLRLIKRVSVGAAIAYAAARSLASQRNRPMTLYVASTPPFRAMTTNIGVVKNPNFSGAFTYRSPYEPDSGFFHVHLCENMSRLRVLITLWRARRRGFIGLPSTRSWRARCLDVEAPQPFPVEFDGETVKTRRASFRVLQEAIRVCS
jgi:diacylglycerol kinase family enzyme